jgi:serine/threonine-protein kinase
MGAVYLGSVRGEAGFARTVAIKCMHAAAAEDPSFVGMFIDEARLTSRVRHPNVVSTLDVAHEAGNLILVMEYVHGEAVSRLMRGRDEKLSAVPAPIATAIAIGALHGLHAAHEALNEDGAPLDIIHRDVSPQNIIVGVDGVARVADFGVAKAAGRLQTTSEGTLKGKIAYMAPEQLNGGVLDRRADVFALGVVLWEMLAGSRLFTGDNEGAIIVKILSEPVPRLRDRAEDVPESLDAIVMQAIDRKRDQRYPTARAMARALEQTGIAASASDVGDWVERQAHERLAQRAAAVKELERNAKRSAESLGRLATEIASTPRDVSGFAAQDTGEAKTELLSTTRGATVDWPARQITSRTWLFVMTALLILSAVGTSLVLGRAKPSAPTSAPDEAPLAAAASALPSPAPSAAVVALTMSSAPAASASTAASSAPSSIPTSPRAVGGGPIIAAPRPSAKPPKDCTDPYTRDELGRKIYKRECLE